MKNAKVGKEIGKEEAKRTALTRYKGKGEIRTWGPPPDEMRIAWLELTARLQYDRDSRQHSSIVRRQYGQLRGTMEQAESMLDCIDKGCYSNPTGWPVQRMYIPYRELPSGLTCALSSHLISSHLISSHQISSHQILSHLIRSHQIPSHLIRSHRISSHLISSHLISSDLISSDLISSHQISSDPIASHQIPSHLISSHLISSHLIRSHLIRSHLISSDLISSHQISSDPIASHLISSLCAHASQASSQEV
jgi:hypothetical protein